MKWSFAHPCRESPAPQVVQPLWCVDTFRVISVPEKVASAQCVYDRVCMTAGGMGELQPPNQVLGEKEGKGRKEEKQYT